MLPFDIIIEEYHHHLSYHCVCATDEHRMIYNYKDLSGILQLVFEAIRGSSYSSDIAIDDFTIKQGPCPAPATCNFESGFCGYTNIGGDQFDWTRAKGSTPSTTTGPHNDHTTNSPAGKNILMVVVL